jgi:enoyl-CoA hydratase
LDRTADVDRNTGYASEIEAYNFIVTQDHQEGVNAFNEKRKPVCKGQ